MTIKKGKGCFTILIMFCVICSSQVFSQSLEKGIISMPDLTVLLNLLSAIDDAAVKHQWDLIFSSFLPPEFTNQYKAGDKWKNLEWVAPIMYPEIKPANAQECIEVANSIKSIRLFISDIIVYKEASCDFKVEIKGVRIIDFLPGKKFIPVDTFFCKKDNVWLLEVAPIARP
jgi:hypothetical protein